MNPDIEITVGRRQPAVRSTLHLGQDSLKMLRETLCVAQSAIGHSPFKDTVRAAEHVDRLGRVISEIDRQRPLGPDGNHGSRHTDTCGCDINRAQ